MSKSGKNVSFSETFSIIEQRVCYRKYAGHSAWMVMQSFTLLIYHHLQLLLDIWTAPNCSSRSREDIQIFLRLSFTNAGFRIRIRICIPTVTCIPKRIARYIKYSALLQMQLNVHKAPWRAKPISMSLQLLTQCTVPWEAVGFFSFVGWHQI